MLLSFLTGRLKIVLSDFQDFAVIRKVDMSWKDKMHDFLFWKAMTVMGLRVSMDGWVFPVSVPVIKIERGIKTTESRENLPFFKYMRDETCNPKENDLRQNKSLSLVHAWVAGG